MDEKKNNKNEFKAAVLEQIADLARNQSDMAQFGINVAGILVENGIISEEIYKTLLGR